MTREKTKQKKSPKTQTGKKKAPTAGKKVSRARRRKPWGQAHCTLFLLGISVLLSIFIGSILYLFVLLDIPNLQSIKDYQPKMATLILDRDQRVLQTVYEENRRVVPLTKMPGLLPKAFVAAEDARFYEHPGVDIWSVIRALFHNIRKGGTHGGSTITQQVTRSLLLSRKKVYSRKIKEAILAYRIDTVMGKEEILYIYLNQIYLGEGAFGVEAAARTYFDTGVENLTLAQMALLAGLPQAPSRYSPLKSSKLAKKRQAYVLNRMAEEGYITAESARRAYNEPLGLNRVKESDKSGNYYSQYVTNYVSRKYGRDLLTTGGLTIYTSMDKRLQQRADTAVKKGIAALDRSGKSGDKPQAAMLVMESGSGRVRAVVGGADFSTSQFNRAIQARRQPGSSFKPIVFAVALERGFTPDSIIIDEPMNLPGTQRGKTWQPKNFEDRHYGPTTLHTGLIHSRNIVAIKLLQAVGIDPVVKMARDLGIRSKIKPDLTLALGSSEVSLLEMTGAYTPFANRGYYSRPILIEKIIDRHGKVLEENREHKVRIMSEKTAIQMDRMLQGVITEGTGREARGLKETAGGKTGTTDRNMDAWFIGYTRDYVTGVWVGHDRKVSLGRSGSGGHTAAPIWLDFMKQVESRGN